VRGFYARIPWVLALSIEGMALGKRATLIRRQALDGFHLRSE